MHVRLGEAQVPQAGRLEGIEIRDAAGGVHPTGVGYIRSRQPGIVELVVCKKRFTVAAAAMLLEELVACIFCGGECRQTLLQAVIPRLAAHEQQHKL